MSIRPRLLAGVMYFAFNMETGGSAGSFRVCLMASIDSSTEFLLHREKPTRPFKLLRGSLTGNITPFLRGACLGIY